MTFFYHSESMVNNYYQGSTNALPDSSERGKFSPL